MTATRLFALAGLAALAACGRSAEPTRGAPAPPDPHAITYACDDERTIEVGYPDRRTAVLRIGGRTHRLAVARSGSGARYVGAGWQWWTKGMTDARLAPLAAGEEIASAAGVSCRADPAPVEPPPPGAPGGLPNDRRPVPEAPFSPTSAQGAANVVQTYFALLEQGRVDEAAKLTSDGRPEDLAAYASYHAQIGAPGRIEGAAGSLYVEVPIVLYGRMKSGGELHRSGRAILRRVNDVPGSSTAERRWRIERLELTP